MEEEDTSPAILDGHIVSISFGLATHQEICSASISDGPISHVSQLANSFLGLPLEFGKCESCGTSEPGNCEGHFGYIELPIPVYHPAHITGLKKLLSLICLKCLKMKVNQIQGKNGSSVAERLLSSCCEDVTQISIEVEKTAEGSCFLVLKYPSRSRVPDNFWKFLQKYGYRYGDDEHSRTLLPCEVMEILKRIPVETRRKLAGKGYVPQDGYILKYLPVPPNCLSVPDVSDGYTSMSSDPSRTVLKDVLKKIESIKNSRSGQPNFESHEVEANDLYREVDKYLQVRGTATASRDIDVRYGVKKGSSVSSTKAWLEKMRTLFIRKGSGFSSRSVITGDSYKRVNEVGIPYEIAQKITFEERVNAHNIQHLQDLVDSKLCLTYRDGATTYSLSEGSKGHTTLRPGQIVRRRIMDGDTVFINRPPTTHKHSLQALSVYIHDDHTVKINPLICGPLGADFDGDCVHLFYPQSFAAKAEVLELFSVEKQLLSSHSGQLNLQLANDSLLSLNVMFEKHYLDKAAVQQLAMFTSFSLPTPAIRMAQSSILLWTAAQVLQLAFPNDFNCAGDKYLVKGSDLLEFSLRGDSIQQPIINEILASIFFKKGPRAVLKFFDSLQPLLMEFINSQGFSVSLEDFSMSRADMMTIHELLEDVSRSVTRLKGTFEDELQLENQIRLVKELTANFMHKSYALRNLIDFKSGSSINKLVQQIGFLGLQLSDKKKLYSKNLVDDMAAFCRNNYPVACASTEFGLIKGCFIHGLDPYEALAHSISTREVIVRSSRGLTEPGTLFKNLMAVLRDVGICYDGTVRNACNNSVVQLTYEGQTGSGPQSMLLAGEPVGVLAATAMSNPAYKAVLDSTPSSNSSWELMKEILLCKVNFKNELNNLRVILYLKDCTCGEKFCQEKAAWIVKNYLKKVSLKDIAMEFTIEYKRERTISENAGGGAGLVGHLHLDKLLLQEWNISVDDVLQKCQEAINLLRKKKQDGNYFKRLTLSVCEGCDFEQQYPDKPYLMFFFQDIGDIDMQLEIHMLENKIYPVLLKTIIKGDPRICSATIIWASPELTTWIPSTRKSKKGEWALEAVIEKGEVKKSGDAWRIATESCLPVCHLIDTERSIPYAIKQVENLLGIQCAFEQAVQRLSTSVKMVSKGVLTEHLVLLANSMTCTGELIGFYPGGFKSMSRSLKLQAPFMEATLYTPRKCFESAAEKCHKDSLSSLVGSVSWGKRVAVGTGSQFDLIFDQKETGVGQEGAIDVYSFLHMVKGAANVEERDTGCLGTDIDELHQEEETVGWCASPELESNIDKPVFEDSAEFQDTFDNQPTGSSWENVQVPATVTATGSGWNVDKIANSENNLDKPDAWSSWTTDKADTQGPYPTETQLENPKSGRWDTAKSSEAEDESSKSGGWGSTTAWGKKAQDDLPGEKVSSSTGWTASPAGNDSWAQANPKEQLSSWGAEKSNAQDALPTENISSSAAWNTEPAVTNSWNQDNAKENMSRWEKEGTKTQHASHISSSSRWNTEPAMKDSWNQGAQKENLSSWGKEESKTQGVADTKDVSGSSVWDTAAADTDSWGQGARKENLSSWGKEESKTQGVTDTKDVSGSSVWETAAADTDSWGQGARKENLSSWAKEESKAQGVTDTKDVSGSSVWDTAAADTDSWGQGKPRDESNTQGAFPADDSWGQEKSKEKSGWSSMNKSGQEESPNSWNQQKTGDHDHNEGNQWGQTFKRNQSEGTKNWTKNTGDWKGKRNFTARPPRGVNDDSGVSALLYTITGQRLDIFTSEEQPVLLDVEPLMDSIRKILHKNDYKDGDPISADEQSFVLEKILHYHPDKDAKMGKGVDYVMVSKHTTFQDSRCFFIVDTDGNKQDFSYLKCLHHFIKEKYPDIGEQFIGKYFKKRGPPRERKPTPSRPVEEKKPVEEEKKPEEKKKPVEGSAE